MLFGSRQEFLHFVRPLGPIFCNQKCHKFYRRQIWQKLHQMFKKFDWGLIRCWFFACWIYIPCWAKNLKIATLDGAPFVVKLSKYCLANICAPLGSNISNIKQSSTRQRMPESDIEKRYLCPLHLYLKKLDADKMEGLGRQSIWNIWTQIKWEPNSLNLSWHLEWALTNRHCYLKFKLMLEHQFN